MQESVDDGVRIRVGRIHGSAEQISLREHLLRVQGLQDHRGLILKRDMRQRGDARDMDTQTMLISESMPPGIQALAVLDESLRNALALHFYDRRDGGNEAGALGP